MTETKKELTLKDRLSHLNYLQACRLLGQQGKDLIHLGGKFEIDIDGQVEIGAESFSVKFADAKTVIRSNSMRRNKLDFECSVCEGHCEHIGATFVRKNLSRCAAWLWFG